jgi:hypothetical protein
LEMASIRRSTARQKDGIAYLLRGTPRYAARRAGESVL